MSTLHANDKVVLATIALTGLASVAYASANGSVGLVAVGGAPAVPMLARVLTADEKLG